MFVRVKQFFSAITSKVHADDIKFIEKYLNHNEQKIFFDMDIPTQRHCLNVAYTCLSLLNDYPKANKEILLKAALLHDCGKKTGEINTLYRVIIVLVHAFFPTFAKHLIKKGLYSPTGKLSRAFYIHHIHHQRGAEIAAKANDNPNVIDLIKNHHNSQKNSDSIELFILQQADSAN
ncbi:HD domain-containing protein [Peptococcaceae bacterium]|nr:HD domain-containing protein [Peptococcaceae bacterium]